MVVLPPEIVEEAASTFAIMSSRRRTPHSRLGLPFLLGGFVPAMADAPTEARLGPRRRPTTCTGADFSARLGPPRGHAGQESAESLGGARGWVRGRALG